VKPEEKIKSAMQDIENQTQEDDRTISGDELPQAIVSKLIREKLSQLNARLKEPDKKTKKGSMRFSRSTFLGWKSMKASWKPLATGTATAKPIPMPPLCA